MASFAEPEQADIFFWGKHKKKGFQQVASPEPPLETTVADTHAHLDMLTDVPRALARAAVHRVGFVCSIVDPSEDTGKVYRSCDQWREDAATLIPSLFETSASEQGEDAAELQRMFVPGPVPALRVACGCHPHNARHYNDELEQRLLEHLRDPLTCAVGEVGLDYHYDLSPREQQREVFRRQIGLAHRTGLPLVLHLREAHEEAFEIMCEEGFPEAGVLLHCFNLDQETLAPWVEKACYVALGGAITFKRSDDTREALKHIPVELLLTETDAPYMAPEPMRSVACEPAHIVFTAQKIAEVRGAEPGAARERLLAQMYDNALTLLDRAPTTWQLEQG